MGDMWPMFLGENVSIVFQVIPVFSGALHKFNCSISQVLTYQLQITLANPIRSIWPVLRPRSEKCVGTDMFFPAYCVLGRHVDGHVLVSLCRPTACFIQQGKPDERQAQCLVDVPLVPGGKC